jgi:hypothetical protein
MHAHEIGEVREEGAEAIENLVEAIHERSPQNCSERTGLYLKLISGSVGVIGTFTFAGFLIQAFIDNGSRSCDWYAQNNCTAPLVHNSCDETHDMPFCQLSSYGFPIGLAAFGVSTALCFIGKLCLDKHDHSHQGAMPAANDAANISEVNIANP